jgi:hypothetical protein
MEDFIKVIKEHWFLLVLVFVGYLLFQVDAIAFFAYKITLTFLLPIGLVFILGWIAFKMWVHYVQQDFISGIDFVLLEIVPPREVLRSPKAMELFFTNALYHFSMKGGREELWQGAVRFWFSLEIASIDGQVHFFIRTPTRVRPLIETQIYAQYPQAQVKAVEDYTLGVDKISPEGSWNGWGCEFNLLKSEAYPIKTYVDFGLDKDPKEEFKVDPISPVIELFASLQKGEQMWLQIVVQPAKKKFHTPGTWFGTHDWVAESKIQIDKLLKPHTRIHPADEVGNAAAQIFTPDQLKKKIEGMVAKPTKVGFDTGIRIMYIAKKEVFDFSNRRNIRLVFRQYENPDSNGFNRVNSTQADAFGSIYFPLSPKKVMILANRMLLEFQERSFFNPPMRHHLFNNHTIKGFMATIVKQFWLPYLHPPIYVLNTEELATLWHFPGQILKVPTLERIESKEASPPTNLPI